MQHLVSVVLFLNRLKRKENFSQVSEQPSAVVVSFRVVWCRAAEMICGCSWVAVLTDVTSTFVPLIGGLVDKSQVGVEQSITRQQEEDKHQKPQHEDDTRESQEKVLEVKGRYCIRN